MLLLVFRIFINQKCWLIWHNKWSAADASSLDKNNICISKFQNTCKKSEMSSFSSGLKLSMSTGSSNEALCFLLNVFLLKDASTSSGFMPALRHLRWSIKIWHWPLPWGFSPVKPAPLAAPPVGQVYAAVPRALHAAVRLPNAPPEEGPAGVASHGPVVEVGGTRTIANAALGGQSPLQSRNYLPLIRWKKTRLSGCQGLTARETDWKSLHDIWLW